MDISRLSGPVIIAGIVCGLLFPPLQIFAPFSNYLIAIIIFSVCINITSNDVITTLKQPSRYLTLLPILFVLQPLATWLVARQFIADPMVLAGLVLVSAAPTPTGLGFWTHALKGNVSLALAFISISHLLTPVIIPILAYYLLGSYVSIDVLHIAETLALVIIIPMAAALLVQKFADIKKYANYISLPAYFLVVAGIIAKNSASIFSSSSIILISVFVLFQCAFSAGLAFLLSRNWSKEDREALILGTLGRNNIIIMAAAMAGFGALAALPGAIAIVIQLLLIGLYLHFKKHIVN